MYIYTYIYIYSPCFLSLDLSLGLYSCLPVSDCGYLTLTNTHSLARALPFSLACPPSFVRVRARERYLSLLPLSLYVIQLIFFALSHSLLLTLSFSCVRTPSLCVCVRERHISTCPRSLIENNNISCWLTHAISFSLARSPLLEMLIICATNISAFAETCL